MALVNCKECGKEVSTKAKACTNCGAKPPPKKHSKLAWGCMWLSFLFLAFVIGIIAISTPPDDGAADKTANKKDAVASRAINEAVIREADYGEKWPLTVPEGVLRCSSASSVTFTASGVTYAVNGSAMSDPKGYAAIEPIWKIDTESMEEMAELTNTTVEEVKKVSGTTRISISPLIEAGLALCER